jgi:hypothetical protein
MIQMDVDTEVALQQQKYGLEEVHLGRRQGHVPTHNEQGGKRRVSLLKPGEELLGQVSRTLIKAQAKAVIGHQLQAFDRQVTGLGTKDGGWTPRAIAAFLPANELNQGLVHAASVHVLHSLRHPPPDFNASGEHGD